VCIFSLIAMYFKPTLTHGYSMKPTLTEGDRAIAMVRRYTPAYGDVVIIRDLHKADKFLVKRIIGLSGDLIDIDFSTGVVTRNGVVIEEPYIPEPTTTPGDVTFPLAVPEGHAFVMGDNRNHSTDSRTTYTGTIPVENIEGKVLFRFHPIEKFGVIK
ncbi:MAG: signal peptidase I, partial [Angelakisella sp.]